MGIFVLGFGLAIGIFLIWLSGRITFQMKSGWSRILVRFVFILSILLMYFSTNIIDYYKFKSICTKEAGLKIYQPLLDNVGWTSSKVYSGTILNNYPKIAFVRFEDGDNSSLDLVRTSDKKNRFDDGFRSYPSDISKQPVYIYKKNIVDVLELKRTVLFEVIAINIANNQTVAIHKNFTHKIFDFDWGPSWGASCESVLPSNLGKQFDAFRFKELQPAFLSSKERK